MSTISTSSSAMPSSDRAGQQPLQCGGSHEVDDTFRPAGDAEAAALQVLRGVDTWSGQGDDRLKLIGPGDADEPCLAAFRAGADRRDIAAMAERTSRAYG